MRGQHRIAWANAELRWSMLVLVLPAIVFWWLLPGIGSLTIGNDYVIWSHRYHLELMYSVWTGSFPLFVPGFCQGQTATALTLGQLYHPIAWVSSLMPGYWSGHALSWHTALRLLTLGLSHLALFSVLRRLRIPLAWAFVLSTLVAYNLRMLDMLRYGASFEAHTGMLLLCSALGACWLAPSSRRLPLLVPPAVAWLLCSGHPPMVWWAVLTAAVFALCFPWIAAHHDVGPEASWRSVGSWLGRMAYTAGYGVLLSAACLLPFYVDFMGHNAGRVGQDYSWATSNTDTLSGTLANFFEPLAADVHGAFGGSGLLVAAALVPALALLRVRLHKSTWLLWGISLLSFLHMQGPRTPVHFWTWKLAPLASAMRIPGRSSQLLPLCFALILLGLGRSLSQAKRGRLRARLLPAGILVALFLVAEQLYRQVPPAFFWGAAVNITHVSDGMAAAVRILGPATVIVLALWLVLQRSRSLGVLLAILVPLDLGLCISAGTWIAARTPTASFATLDAAKSADIRTPFGNPGDWFSSSAVEGHLERGLQFPEELARLCFDAQEVGSQEQAYDLLDHAALAPDACVLEASSPSTGSAAGTIRLQHSSYNQVVMTVESAGPVWLLLSYPHSGRWRASLDGEATQVVRADGVLNAVWLPGGSVQVDWRYSSWAAVVGGLLTALAWALLSALAAWRCVPARWRRWGLVPGPLLCLVTTIMWWQSLYPGG